MLAEVPGTTWVMHRMALGTTCQSLEGRARRKLNRANRDDLP